MGAGSGMQQSFNNADKVMSEANSNDGFSGATDAPVAEASVNAHGSGIVAALRTRAWHAANEAGSVATQWMPLENRITQARSSGKYEAFLQVLTWLDELEANAATSTGEGRKPNA
jgi:hypothetical protein